VEIQRQLSKYNESREDGILLQARIGIGAGEPVQDGDALFGSTVNLVARICSYGESGQIITAKVVKDLCIGKPITFSSLGSQMLKGFDEPVDLELIEW
jgi:class 3 adenylate cyclase